MSNGGGQTVKESEININKNFKERRPVAASRNNEFAQGVAKIAVAQICESVGFQGFQQTALDVLSDVAARYIREIGKTATLSANLAGRCECNAFDVVHGLEDVSSVQGFSGGSSVHRCLLASGAVKEIVGYVGEAEEIPFAYAIPEFPIVKERKLSPCLVGRPETLPGEPIPEWLPIFPDPETYAEKQSGGEKEGESGVKTSDEEVLAVKIMERPLLSLQHKWACNGSGAEVLAAESGDAIKAKKVVESNLFLAPPLPSGEKEVSPVTLPAKLSEEGEVRHQNGNHVSISQTFASAVEAAESRPSQSKEDRQQIVSNGKPSVQLKFKRGRKSLYTAMKIPNEKFEMSTSLFSTDTKKRAEEMIGESLEYQKGLDHV